MIHIKTPFFTAGRMFNWPGKPIGIGISLAELKGEGILLVKVGQSDKIWQMEKPLAREFVKRFQSYFDAKGTKLGIIAWHMFTAKDQVKQMQKKLFL